MKLIVVGKHVRGGLVLLVLTTVSSSPLLAQNVAQCQDPPGGTIICEQGQIATCEVRSGKVYGRCKTPPSDRRGAELQAWVLSDLLGQAVSVSDLQKPEYKSILQRGRLERGGNVVTFNIPKELLEHKQQKSPQVQPKTGPSVPPRGGRFVCEACRVVFPSGERVCKKGYGPTESEARSVAIRNLCGSDSRCAEEARVMTTCSESRSPYE